MSTYLPPVVLHLRVTAREAYAELAKFQAAVNTAMKGAAAQVNAGGKDMEYAAKHAARRAGAAMPPALMEAIKPEETAKRIGTSYSKALVKTMVAPVRLITRAHIDGYKAMGRAGMAAAQQVGKAFMTALPYIGIAASSVGLIATAAAAASVKIVALGRGIAALGPLVAFAPSAVIGFKLLKSTIGAVTKGITDDFKPVSKALEDAKKRAAEVGSRGFGQVAADFKRLNLPAITGAMDSIATSANRAGLKFAGWVNSAPGMKLIRDTARGTADAFKAAAPKVEAAAEALGNLANKGDIRRRLERVGEAVGRLADKFKKWADSKTAKDITNGLKTAGDALGFLKDKIGMVKDAITWMADNQDKIKQFSDAMAAVGIAIGIGTGNPIAIAIGALTLLANHWDTVKASVSDAGAWWAETWRKVQQDPSIIRITQAAQENWDAFREGFDSTLGMIQSQWDKVWPEMKQTWDEVGPTIASAWESAKPFVKGFGQFLGVELTAMIVGIRMFLGVVRAINSTFIFVATAVGVSVRAIMNFLAGLIDGAAAVVGVFDKDLANGMRSAADKIRDQAARIQGAIDDLHGKDLWINVNVRGASGLDTNNKLKANPDKYGSNAVGTTHWRGGMTWVGERGPELMDLPRGAAVYRTGASAMMAKGGGFGDMRGAMSGAGSAAAAGLAAGMSAGAGGVTAVAARIAASIPKTTADVLEIRSPSRKMKPLGSAILSGVQRGMEEMAPSVFKYLRAFSNRIAGMKVSTAMRTRIQNIVTGYMPRFNDLKALDGLIDKQRQKIQALKQARAQMASSVAGTNYGGAASLIGAIPEKGAGGTGYLASDYARVLEQRAGQLKAFQRNLQTLKGRGVSKSVLSQFAAAGYEQSGSLVESLTTANSGILRNVNKQTAALTAGSKGLGNTWAGEMYNSGVRAAEGVLKGLRSKRAALAREMAALARSLVAAIKRALRIKSPSGVLADEVGEMIPKGVAVGVLRATPKAVAAAQAMARAAVPTMGRSVAPQGSGGGGQMLLPGGPGGAGAVDVHSHLYLDGREVYTSTQRTSLRRENRNGSNGLSKVGAR